MGTFFIFLYFYLLFTIIWIKVYTNFIGIVENPKFVVNNRTINKFTIVVSTYSERFDLLKGFLQYYGSGTFKYLNEILIFWNDIKNGSPPPKLETLLNFISKNVTLKIKEIKGGAMDDRFCIPDEITSDTILILDDDIRTPVPYLESTFNMIVKQSLKHRIVGFVPRHFYIDNKSNIYYRLQLSHGKYSMILSGFCFFPSFILRSYCHLAPQGARQVVRKYSCDDISMNFFNAWKFNISALYVNCPFVQISKSGLSLAKNYLNNRHRCLNDLTKVYGYLTLKNAISTEKIQCPYKPM